LSGRLFIRLFLANICVDEINGQMSLDVSDDDLAVAIGQRGLNPVNLAPHELEAGQ
jgi:transcription antitermination factor NusA-like protein